MASTGSAVAVHQHHQRVAPGAGLQHRAPHREHRGVQDVQPVDLFHAGFGDAAGQRAWRGSRRTGAPALSGRQHLGVRQAMRSDFSSSRITAAATTGPASGPRPASSTPATRPCQADGSLRTPAGTGLSATSRGRRLERPGRAAQPCDALARSHRLALLRRVLAQLVRWSSMEALSARRCARAGSSSQASASRANASGVAGVLDQFGHHEIAAQDVGQAEPGLAGSCAACAASSATCRW